MNATPELLAAALAGYEQQKREIDAKMAEIHEELNATIKRATPRRGRELSFATGRPRTMSAAGRARIAAATKKRWAAYRKAKKANAA